MGKRVRRGSLLNNGIRPTEGMVVWGLLSYPIPGLARRLVKGTVARVSDIDGRGLANTYVDMVTADGLTFHFNVCSLFDHQPHREVVEDEWGKVQLWR